MLDEKTLLDQIKQGDSRAVARWFRLYRARLTALVVSRVSSSTDAEEIVQEVFINCLKQIQLFRGESSLWTWMCSIANHEVADYFRKKYAKKALKTLPLHELFLKVPLEDAQEVSERVKRVLVRMTKTSSELLQLKYIDGKKVSEIASIFGKSVKAIESDLFRARVEFKELWQREYVYVDQ